MIPPVMASNSVLADQGKTGEAIAQAVRAAGLKRAVHLSSIGADLPSGTGPVVALHQQEARLNAIEGLHTDAPAAGLLHGKPAGQHRHDSAPGHHRLGLAARGELPDGSD
jgi:hypothetical protein